MLSSDARVVRGLSIANIILSSLAIVGTILVLAFTAFAVIALNDPSMSSAITGSLDVRDLNGLRSYDITNDEIMSISGGLIGIFGGLIGIWLLIGAVVTLIAGIIDLRSCGNNEKLKGAFVWAIVGAVVAFLTGSIITTVLFIVAAVYLNKLKQAAQPPYGQAGTYGQPMPYGQAAPYGQPLPPQPYGQAPQQQPQQPSAQPQPQTQQPSAQPQQAHDPNQNTPDNPQA